MSERNRGRAENPHSHWGRTNRYGRWYALGRVLTLLAMAALPVQTVHAATVTWDGSDDALWGTAANWDTVTVPGAGDTAVFNAAAGIGGGTITTGTISLGTLVFDTGLAAAYTIGGATAGTGQITFADGTTNIITMNSTVTQNELVNANLVLGTAIASTSTITNSSTTNTLTLAGSITGGTGGTAAAKTLIIDGAGATTISGNITKGGASTLTLTDTSTGTLTVSGNTTVNQLNMNSVGGSVIDIGGGNLTISGITSGGIGLRSTTGGTINGTGTIAFTQNSATNGTDNGTANGTTLTINPRITGANAFESFVASGNTGKLVLANNGNDFTGNVLINSGIVEVATIGASGVASGAGKGTSIQIGSGTNTGATLRYTGTGSVTNRTLNFAGTTGGATIDASGTGALIFSNTAAIAAGAGIKTVALTGTGALRIDGILQDNSATNKTNVSKNGTGTVILGGVNTYTGTTSITGGNLVFLRNQTLAGNVTQNNAGLTYAGTSDAALNLSGTLAITGGANAVLGGSIGATSTSSQILVTGNATATAAALKVNVYGVSGVSPATGTYTLLKSNGAAPTLNNAVLSLGTVYNNTNFTVGALSSTASDISVDVTSATPLTTAFWNGGLTGATNVWAASDGTANSNWVTAAGGGATALVPGGSTAVTISATTPTVAPTSTVLGANMTIGSLTIANTGGLGLNADGYALTVNSGITMNSGVAASTIASGLVTGGAQTWTNSSANVLTLSGNISGTGLVTKAGTGPLTISGLGTYTGGLTLSTASTLRINSVSALGTGTFTIGAAGTLDNTSGSAITLTPNNVLALNSNFTFTGTNDLNMGTGATTINAARTITVNGGNLTLGGTLGMAGFGLTKAGAGTLTLSGVISGTTANGSTSMTVSGGTLAITGTNNSFSGNIVVNGATSVLQVGGSNGSATGGMLGYVVNGTTTAAYKQITLSNGGTFRPTASFNDNNVTTALPANGYVFNMGTGGGVFDVPSGVTLSIDDGTGTGTAAGASQLQGSGSLTKTGLGTLNQDDSTAYAGAIIVTAGTLQPSTGNAFGATSAGTTIQSGARLNVNGVTMTNQEPLTINGTGLASAPAGALTNASGTAATWVGPVTLGSASTIGSSAAGGLTLSSTATVNTAGNTLTLAISGAGRIFTDGVISGAGAVIVNGSSTGDYVPRAGHTYTGGTTLNAGSFTAIDFNSTGPAGNPTAGPFGSGTAPLVLNGGQMRSGTGGTRTIGNTVTLAADTSFYTVTTEKSLVFSGPVTITGASRTLTSNVGATVGSAVVEFSGAIGDGGNGFGLTKAGAGNLILSGANTYTGATFAQDGFLGITGSLQNNTGISVATGAGNNATMSFINGAVNTPTSLSALALGNATGSTAIGLDLGTTSDQLSTTAGATAAGPITFHLNAASGFAAGTYTLISAASGLTAGGASYGLGIVPGGYTYAFNNTDAQVQLVSTAVTGANRYWRGNLGTSWATFSGLTTTNWATDAAGTIVSASTPGSGDTVIFSATSATGPTITTTLDNNFTINALQFAAAPTGVTAVTINPGLNPGTAAQGTLTIAPSVATAGMTLAQGAGAVTVAAPITLGASQTWSVDSSTPGAGTASALTVSGPISGGAANGLTMTTTAGTTPIIVGATGSTYSGATTISANTIVQGGATNGFSPNSALTVGGTLNTGAFNQAIGSLIGGSGIVQNGSATNATLTIGSDNLASATFAGTIQNGSTGTLGVTKAGTGIQILSGTNTYTGTTTVSAGTLQIGTSSAYSAASGLVVNGGIFDVNGNSVTVASIGGAATGTITNSSSSTAASTATAPGTPTGAGVYVDALTISGAGGTFAPLITDGATRKLQLITNNANSGTGLMGFTNGALNTFSGGLVLANSATGTRLNINAAITGTPFGTGPIIVGQAATDKAGIYMSAASTLNNPVVSNTTLGTDRVGTFRIDSTVTLAGTLTANLAPMALSTNGTGTATITGKITGPEGFQLLGNALGGTALTVTLSNAAGTNDYQGDTIVNFNPQTKPYTLKLGANNQIPDGTSTGNLILNTNGAGIATFDLAGLGETINGLSGNAGSVVTNSSATTASILTLGGNNQTATFAGVIQETAGGGLALTKIGSGIQTLSGANTFTGAVNANGGLIAFASSPATSGPLGNSTVVNLDGGGISYTASGVNALNRNAAIGAGNGTIDVASSTGTLTVASLTSSGGNLVKTGPGALSLTATTTLNGGAAGVVVNGGTLQGGYGTGGIRSITVGSSGNLSFQNSAIEALTLGSSGTVLSLSNGARLGFELDGANSDSIIVPTGGGLSLSGSYTFDFFNSGAGVGANTYTLLTAPAGSALNTFTYNLGSAPLGYNYSFVTSDTMVQLLTVAYTPIYWNNTQGDGSWANVTGNLGSIGAGAGTNFTSDLAGTTDAGHAPLATETVIFNTSAIVGPSITTNLDGSRTVDSLQFNGSGTPAVTLVTIAQGSGGTLTLKPASASGGIAIPTGGSDATISAPLALDNTLSASQTWSVVDAGRALTLSGNVNFGANVNKSGAGTLTLSGANTGSGNLTLSAGTLNLNSAGALSTGTLSIAAGTTLNNTSGGAVTLTGNGPVNITGDFTFTGSNNLAFGTGAVNISNNPTVTTTANTLTFGGAVTGASGLTTAGAGTLVLSANNTYTGTTNVNGGVLTLSGANTTTGQTVLGGGTVNVNHANALGTGALVINSGGLGNTSAGAIVNAGSQAITVNGNFSFSGPNDLDLGSSAITLNVTPTITTTAGTLTIGNIGNTPLGLGKGGAGTLTMVGTNQYKGNTTIDAGTFNLTGSLLGNNTTSTFSYGTTAGNTIVNMSGTLNAWATRGANIAGSVAVFNQTAGSVTIVPTNGQDQQYLANNGGYGMLNITGGTFNTGRFDGTGATSSNASTAVIYVGGSGTLNQNVGDWFLPIRNNGMMSMTVAPGGNFVRSSAVTAQFSITGLSMSTTNNSSYGILNVAGGNVDTGTKGINFSQGTFASGTFTSTGFVNVAGGTFSLGLNTGVGAAAGTTNGYFNFAGGTVKATNTMSAVIPANTANYIFTSTIYGPITNNNSANAAFNTQVGTTSNFTGGMVVDTNSFNVTFSNPLLGADGKYGVTQADITIPSTGNSGYIGAPMVQFAAPAAGGAPASGYALISGGQVTGIVITSPGSYASGETPLITLTGGGGSIAPFTTSAITTAHTSAGITKNSAGTLVLSSGASTFKGPIVVNEGILQWNGALTNIGAAGAFGLGDATSNATNAASLVLNGSTWSIFNASTSSTDRLFTVNQNGGTVSADNTTAANLITLSNTGPIVYTGSGVRTLTLGGAHPGGAANANTFAPQITDAGADAVTLQKTGTTNWLLTNAANSYTGGTNIQSGILGFASGALGTTGNITFTGNSTLQWGTGNTQDVSSRLVMTNGVTSTLDTNGNNIAPASALGNSSSGALNKAGAGTLTVSVPSTYTGQTTVSGGTLSISSNAHLGDQVTGATLNLSGGTLQTTATLGLFNGTAGTNNRNVVLTGSSSIDVASTTTLTIAGTMTGTGSLTKIGAGTLTLSGLSATAANNYSGGTTLDGGTTVFTSDAALTGALTFGASNGSTSASTLDLSAASATFGSLVALTNNATANTITVGTGRTLSINGNVALGYDAGAGTGATLTKLTVNGGGSMSVTGTTVAIGTNQAATNAAYWNDSTLDVTALGSFSANVTNFNIGVGGTTQGPGALLLSNTANTILATTLTAGDTGGNNGRGTGKIQLGSGTNVIQVDTFNIGRGKGVTGGTGLVEFVNKTAGSPGTVTIINKAGTGPANITVGDNNGTATAGGATGTLDLRGHVATVTAGTLLAGRNNMGSNSGNVTSDVYFDAGTFTVNTITMAQKTAAGTGAANATLNIGGGSFTVNSGGSFTLASQATGGSAAGTLNITGGTFTSNVDILDGGGTATTTTITLNGGTLDMTGKNIGSATAIDNLNLQSGTLKNVAQINNGGAISKTTAGTLVMTGNLAYTGATNVTDGTLTYDAASSFSPATANGMLNVNGAAAVVNIAGTYNSPDGNGSAFITTQGGGVLNFSGNSTLTNGATGAGIRIGDGSAGTMNMTAGTMTLTLNATANLVIGRSAGGNGILNLSGGTLTVNGAGGLLLANTAGNSGTLTIGGTGQLAMNATAGLTMGGGTSTINLNTGGTFTLATAAAASGTSTINFDGGTLRAGLNTSSLLPAALTAANVLAGGAKVDTNGFDVTIANTLLTGVPGDGGLTKSGTGSLTLSAANTYTGGTVASAGTLQVDGSIAASSGVTVAGSATFVAGTTQVVKTLNLSAASSNASILAGAIRVLSVGDNTAASPLTLTGGKLDLNTSALVVDFSAGNEASNLTAMKTAILAGRGTGVWDGTSGLTSTAAAAASSVYGVGYAPSSIATGAIAGVTPDADAVVARYTRLGDANLDGAVNFFDLTALAAAYGGAGEWYNGDFDYSGTINFFDLTALAANYGTGLPSEAIPGATPEFSADLAAAFASVPEPGAISLLGLAALALLKRRNNRKAA